VPELELSKEILLDFFKKYKILDWFNVNDVNGHLYLNGSYGTLVFRFNNNIFTECEII
jgi:hypothetical protein